jgi:sec-independent protein translocase protein TatC
MVSIRKFIRRRSPEERVGAMTVMEHLEELRHRIVIAIIALALGSVVGWFLYPWFIHLVRVPYCDYVHSLPPAQVPAAGCSLVYSAPLDPMLVKLKIVLFLGLGVSLPVVLYQLWAFIVPGLTPREKKLSIPFIVSSTLLFALGGLVAFVTLPKALNFLLGFAGGQDVTPFIQFNSYVSFVVLVTLAFGVSFEFPILLIFLLLVGVLTTARLRSWRRWSILGIAVFAAVITPSSDPYSMLAMMIPMVLFYEGSIIVGRLMKK